MKEIGRGVFEVEEGDDVTLDKLNKHVEEMVKIERARLNEVRGHAWWADAVFYLHDMITFTGIMREHFDAAQVADAIIETTTVVGKSMLEHALGTTDEAVIRKAWSDLLFDAKALDDMCRARVNADPSIPAGVGDAIQADGGNTGPLH